LGSGRIGGLELGDARRTRRLSRLVEELSAHPLGSLPVASGGWAETQAAYRLLANPALEWREGLEVHTPQTRERMAGQPVVLCIQDSPELDVTTPPGMVGRGRLSYEAQHGRYVHPPLVVTPPGAALGVIAAWMGARAPKGKATVKASVRGREGYGSVAELAEVTAGTRFV